MPCSQTPGTPPVTALTAAGDGVFWIIQTIDHPVTELIGVLSLQPLGLRPTASLSTLNLTCYQAKPKTRYGVWQVVTSPTVLSTVSSQAPRSAQISIPDFILLQPVNPHVT